MNASFGFVSGKRGFGFGVFSYYGLNEIMEIIYTMDEFYED